MKSNVTMSCDEKAGVSHSQLQVHVIQPRVGSTSHEVSQKETILGLSAYNSLSTWHGDYKLLFLSKPYFS